MVVFIAATSVFWRLVLAAQLVVGCDSGVAAFRVRVRVLDLFIVFVEKCAFERRPSAAPSPWLHAGHGGSRCDVGDRTPLSSLQTLASSQTSGTSKRPTSPAHLPTSLYSSNHSVAMVTLRTSTALISNIARQLMHIIPVLTMRLQRVSGSACRSEVISRRRQLPRRFRFVYSRSNRLCGKILRLYRFIA